MFDCADGTCCCLCVASCFPARGRISAARVALQDDSASKLSYRPLYCHCCIAGDKKKGIRKVFFQARILHTSSRPESLSDKNLLESQSCCTQMNVKGCNFPPAHCILDFFFFFFVARCKKSNLHNFEKYKCYMVSTKCPEYCKVIDLVSCLVALY